MTTTCRKGQGGRPPKFAESRRAVTVTLPDRTLKSLERVSADRARAIVKCVDAVVRGNAGAPPDVELVEVMSGKALIIVGPCQALGRIEWLKLVEIAPARYLIMLPSGKPIECLEVEIQDILDGLGPDDEDRPLLERLREVMVTQRRRRTVSKAELILVDTGSSR